LAAIGKMVLTVWTAVGLGGAAAALVLLAAGLSGERGAASVSLRPVWTEVPWPFALDPWGRGKAFRCKSADCGTEVSLYLRAKLGSCNCMTGVAEDADVDRMGDLYLVGGEVAPLAPGNPIRIGRMNGRSRAYALTGRNPAGSSALSLAFSDRCDMVVATIVLPDDRPGAIEPVAIDFLNSRPMLDWAEVTLGM
jgi:hypothetical protein